VQHWLQSNGARDANLARAGLEERTLLRRFQKATRLGPAEYCQQLRVGRAREMLEFTSYAVDRIAFSIGYEDAGAIPQDLSQRDRYFSQRTPQTVDKPVEDLSCRP